MLIDTPAALHDLAVRKGFTVEWSPPKSRWRLRNDETGDLSKNLRGSAWFSMDAAMKLLSRHPDLDRSQTGSAAR